MINVDQVKDSSRERKVFERPQKSDSVIQLYELNKDLKKQIATISDELEAKMKKVKDKRNLQMQKKNIQVQVDLKEKDKNIKMMSYRKI